VSGAQSGAYHPSDQTTCGGQQMFESYGYTPGGLTTHKGWSFSWWETAFLGGVQTMQRVNAGPDAHWTYDNEGHTTAYSMLYSATIASNGGNKYNTFNYTLDAMGRPTALTETAFNNANTVLVQNAAYGPGGESQSLQYRTNAGTYYNESRTYNNRAQLKQLQASGTGLAAVNLQYVYPAATNNGQIAQTVDGLSGEQVTYTYDSLKRLIQAQTTQAGGWGQSFGYDGFGNLQTKTATAGHTGTAMSLSIDVSTNRATNSGFAYDANGNATSMPASPSNISLSYDVENRTGGAWFDLENQPLQRAGVWNLYGLRGERLETLSLSYGIYTIDQNNLIPYGTAQQVTQNVYFMGRLIQSNGRTVVTDRLGSVRANDAGDTFGYYPYGEELTVKNPQDREKFATYTRESATGLDYANQRYYSSAYGRFLTPDRYRAASSGNQTPGDWNRYAYVTGNPISLFDPHGMYGCDPDDPSCEPGCDLITDPTCWSDPLPEPGGPIEIAPPPGSPYGSCAPQIAVQLSTVLNAVLLPGSTCDATFQEALPLTKWNQITGTSGFLPQLAGAAGTFGTITIGAESVFWEIVVGAVAPEVLIGVAGVAAGIALYGAITHPPIPMQTSRGNIKDTGVVDAMRDQYPGVDPCVALPRMLTDAQNAGDGQLAKRIITTMKGFGCRNVQKRGRL
jgi:RHS repeat-associated protein